MSSFASLAINPVLHVSTDTTKDSSSTMLPVHAAPPDNESGPRKDDLPETALLKAVDAYRDAVLPKTLLLKATSPSVPAAEGDDLVTPQSIGVDAVDGELAVTAAFDGSESAP
ncbi:hypothetical protein PIB30_057663 [Stylosanthes scabra]|uniref:Uncharacterized protein n=1 Tax=Stylosanthes scabra TaxID=79078 RepID=A0ABU6QK63_9FABA|nr:hypothetical protein [Stylosanthes scabra]